MSIYWLFMKLILNFYVNWYEVGKNDGLEWLKKIKDVYFLNEERLEVDIKIVFCIMFKLNVKEILK